MQWAMQPLFSCISLFWWHCCVPTVFSGWCPLKGPLDLRFAELSWWTNFKTQVKRFFKNASFIIYLV